MRTTAGGFWPQKLENCLCRVFIDLPAIFEARCRRSCSSFPIIFLIFLERLCHFECYCSAGCRMQAVDIQVEPSSGRTFKSHGQPVITRIPVKFVIRGRNPKKQRHLSHAVALAVVGSFSTSDWKGPDKTSQCVCRLVAF